jgi:pilus assembly protein Flp/PilA
MRTYLPSLPALGFDKRGVTAMEYGLIAAFIAVAIIGAITTVGVNLTSTFQNIGSNL